MDFKPLTGPLPTEFVPIHSLLKNSRGLKFLSFKIWRKINFWQSGLYPSVIKLTLLSGLGNGKGGKLPFREAWYCPEGRKLGSVNTFYLS